MSNTRVYVSFPNHLADAFRFTTRYERSYTVHGLEADNKEDLEILAGCLETMQRAVALKINQLGEETP